MNASWFWKQGRPALTTHLKAITSLPRRNDNGCWLRHSGIEFRLLESLSSQYPCGFRNEASCKAMIGYQSQTNSCCFEDSTGVLQTHLSQSVSRSPGHCLSWNRKRKCQLDSMSSTFQRLAMILWLRLLWKAEHEIQKPTPTAPPKRHSKISMVSSQKSRNNWSRYSFYKPYSDEKLY